jgi:hypothetical protein
MRFDPQAGVTSLDDANEKRRRSGRLALEQVRCELGEVLDLSSHGMRVRSRKAFRVGDVRVIVIEGLGGTLGMKSRIVWIKRNGMFRHEVGFEFMDVDPDLARKLTQMAMANRRRRTD